MNTELIQTLTSTFEAHAQQTEDGVEYWLARDIQHLLGYAKWENFLNVVSKAKTACEVSGHKVSDHFPDVGKMVCHGMARYLTCRLGLGDDIQEVVPLGVAKQILKVTCQPELDATVGLLGVTFEGACQRTDELCFHALPPSVNFDISVSNAASTFFAKSACIW